jgi:long-chain acyl-CoA synthetase
LKVDNNESWNKQWPKLMPKHIDYPTAPLQVLLQKTAQKHPRNTAMVYGKSTFTYAQLDLLTNQFANALLKLGVSQGDRVALYLPNIPQYVIAYFGALQAGAAVTAISPLHREREIEHQLTDSGAKTIVTLDSLAPVVNNVRKKTALESVIVSGVDDYNSTTEPQSIPDTLQFKPLVENAAADMLNSQINPDVDLAALQYTGGTTGTAKGAMLTHKNLVSNALAFASWIQGVIQDTFLVALPLFHIYGMTTSMTVPVSLGAKMILVPKFDPAKMLDTIQQHKVTVFCGVPTMYAALVTNPELGKYDLTSIRVCISGASPLPPQVQKRFMEVTGGFLAEGYGLTEASPVTHCNPVDKTMKLVKVGSIGLPIADTEAKIVNLETGGKTLDSGEIGELAVRGPQVMKGYWKKPDETALVLCDGWLLTGDIARMDDDGYFYITDRKKDLIKYKDYSVYPREIEDILYEHPAVRLCAVVGEPDPAVGEIPKAYVVLKECAIASKEEIMAFVNDKVAPYKAIRIIELRSELPISSSGKVLRRQLKKP